MGYSLPDGPAEGQLVGAQSGTDSIVAVDCAVRHTGRDGKLGGILVADPDPSGEGWLLGQERPEVAGFFRLHRSYSF